MFEPIGSFGEVGESEVGEVGGDHTPLLLSPLTLSFRLSSGSDMFNPLSDEELLGNRFMVTFIDVASPIGKVSP